MRPTVSPPDLQDESELSAELDEALSHLRARESTAVVLRYLQNKPMNDVAAAMGISVAAAQKVVARSLPKLRRWLERRGIMLSSTAVLVERIAGLPSHSAPIGLLTSISTANVESLSIAKGVLNMMTGMKIKVAAFIGASVVLAGPRVWRS